MYFKTSAICCHLLTLCMVTTTDSESIVMNLFNKIKKGQILHESKLSIFPPSLEMFKGMYPNEVKLNFHGNEEYFLMRDSFKVPDNNMFTPAWVTVSIIEAYIYGDGPKPTTEQVNLALHAIDRFRNRNEPYMNSEMTFWEQKLNETANFFQSSPDNLFEILRLPDYLPQKLIEEILSSLGLKDMADALALLFRTKDTFALAFHIPPDFDDTFVNIGLGSLLKLSQDQFSDEYQTWAKQNSNLTSVFEKVKKYAYRPFSKESRKSTIDPRTYMYLRTFLDQAKANNEDIALISTWIQDSQEVITLFDKGVVMPFNVNNVDVTVSANFLYGIVTCVLSGICDEHVDAEIQKIFMNTTALIAHELSTNISSRPDLALTYYPSKHEFFWFVSRSYSHLNRMYSSDGGSNVSSDLQQMLKYAFEALRPVLRRQMSDDVVGAAKIDDDGSMYMDNFLGNDDVDFLNRSVNRAEDRIFTTAVSVNALINTWTLKQNNGLVWENDTPISVRNTVRKMAEWLDKNSLSNSYKPWNTFFSGSGKGVESMPFFYPANRREFFNGTTFSDKKFPATPKNIIGMKGYVSPQEYSNMLKQPHFGRMTQMSFEGYNSDKGSFFPFWSCDSYTYAVAMLALAQYENITN